MFFSSTFFSAFFSACSIYIEDGISRVINSFTSASEKGFGVSLFSTIIAVLVFSIALFLNSALTWKSLTKRLRELLVDYAGERLIILEYNIQVVQLYHGSDSHVTPKL